MEYILVNIFTFLGLLLTTITIVFIVAVWRSDNSVMDIAYGPTFFITALFTLFITGAFTPTALMITGLTGLWAMRLGMRIYKKNLGRPEDARYAAWRSVWMERGYNYFLRRSYLQINLLQGAIIALVSIPFLIAINTSPAAHGWTIIGLVIFIFGLGYESLADYQLDQFLAKKRAGTESAPIMTTGLFRFSRRPNYFGETLIWWSFAIMVLPLPFGFLGIISPLVITYIVTKVTGPMLENIFLEKYPAEYRAYMETTNYFIPGPKKN